MEFPPLRASLNWLEHVDHVLMWLLATPQYFYFGLAGSAEAGDSDGVFFGVDLPRDVHRDNLKKKRREKRIIEHYF